MSTISFSIEDELKQYIVKSAQKAKKSQSDLLRDMVITYKFSEEMNRFGKLTEKALADLGIKTEEELYDYLESDETYKSRLRQQHLPRGH